jgi:hypothetical protein
VLNKSSPSLKHRKIKSRRQLRHIVLTEGSEENKNPDLPHDASILATKTTEDTKRDFDQA